MSTGERRIETLRGAVDEAREHHPDVKLDEADIVRTTTTLHPYLYDGSFVVNLGKMKLFTPEQAHEANERKRKERELEIELTLMTFLAGLERGQ